MNAYISLLWKNYKQREDIYYRDKLISNYRPFIKSIVNHIYSKLPKTVDANDIESYANIGLLDAIEKYDMDRDIKFETYATYRIKGAILDGVRKQDWLSRSLRSRYKNYDDSEKNNDGQFFQKGYQELKNGSVPEVNSKKNEACAEKFYMYSLDDPDFYNIKLSESSGSLEHIYEIYNNSNADFSEKLELKLFLKQLLSKLNTQEKTIVYLYYFRGKKLKEIGKMMNISESRVSQINRKILSYLKKEISKASSH